MRKNVKIIISCIVTLCLTISLLGYLTKLMERKSSYQKYADFFSQEEDFNVLFMGTSHVINSVYPMELWDDYGIVSYNLGGHGNQMPTTYWTMENALDYTKPELMVIDCVTLSDPWKCSFVFSYLHLSLDAFPLSVTKARAILDLLDDPNMDAAIEQGNTEDNSIDMGSDEPRTKIGLLWDYSVFHNRWRELEENDFKTSINREKGAESRINVVKGQLNKIDSFQKVDLGTVGEEYLRKMIEDCQSRGIDVLLTYFPFPANEQQQKEANYLYDLADEYGVNYINFLDVDLINYQTDLYDESSHLNPSGARKVTEYLGKYISEHYSVEDQRNNEKYAKWYQDYAEYTEMKSNNLREQTDLVNYLMLLSGEKADIVLDVRNKDLYKDSWIMNLLENIGVDKSFISENTDFIIKMNEIDKAVVIDDFRDNGKNMDTFGGKIELLYDDNTATGSYRLVINGTEYPVGTHVDETGLNICVRRGDSVVDNVGFIYSVDEETSTINVSSTIRE